MQMEDIVKAKLPNFKTLMKHQRNEYENKLKKLYLRPVTMLPAGALPHVDPHAALGLDRPQCVAANIQASYGHH